MQKKISIARQYTIVHPKNASWRKDSTPAEKECCKMLVAKNACQIHSSSKEPTKRRLLLPR